MENSIENKIKALRKYIRYHNRLYHIESKPEISDYEFDVLMRELEDLEYHYPHLITTDSPTQVIGPDCI